MNHCEFCGTGEIFGEHVKICARKYLEHKMKEDQKLASAIGQIGLGSQPSGEDSFP